MREDIENKEERHYRGGEVTGDFDRRPVLFLESPPRPPGPIIK